MKWGRREGQAAIETQRLGCLDQLCPTLRRPGRTFVGGVPGVTPEGGHDMAVVEEDFSIRRCRPRLQVRLSHLGPLGGDDEACACGCPEYRAGPLGLASAEGDQAVA